MRLNFLPVGKALLCFVALLFFALNVNAQCIPMPGNGCSLGANAASFTLTGTTLSINNPTLTCPSSPTPFGGYEDRTFDICTVNSPGGPYNGTISSAASLTGSNTFQIYIDFNNDGTFDAAESFAGSGFISTTPTTDPFTITVPAGITAGDYRMRVLVTDVAMATYPSIDPCLENHAFPPPFPALPYNFGNAVDYTIRVSSGPTCTAPTVTLGAATCSTQVFNWAAVTSATGYEYVVDNISTSPSGSGTTLGATTYTATGLTSGTTYYFHVRTNCGTGFSTWVNQAFTVSGPGPITGNPATCPGVPTQLSNSAGGGVWSSSNTNAATVNGSGLVTGGTPGSTVISYTLAGCTSTFTMNVGSMPPIGGNLSVCPGGTTQLSNAVPGGTWSSSSPTVASVGTSTGLVTAGPTPGTTVITYSNAGCSATATVTVSALPAITGGNSVCVGATLALSNATPGGAWSSATTTVATIDPSTGVVTGVTSGSTNIVYTLGSCSVNLMVTVDAAISPITGASAFCVTSTTTLNTTTAGGTWSSGTPGVATVSATGVVTGVTAGTVTISYTKGGCSITKVLTVDPNTVTISGLDTLCKGVGHEANLSANSPGGTWSSSNTARATVDPSTGVVTGIQSGQPFIITYTVTNTCGALTATKNMYVRSATKCATGIDPTVGSDVADLRVFPNPNSGTFTLNLSSPVDEEVHIVITNIVGAKVSEYVTATNKKTDIQLNVPGGIYLISAATAHDRYVKRVVIDK